MQNSFASYVDRAHADSDSSLDAHPPLAVRIAMQVGQVSIHDFDTSVLAKVKTCLFDLIGCSYEAAEKPWSRQAMQMAAPASLGHTHSSNVANIIGMSQASSLADAAFVNSVMGHGLVREDMHSASISHLGVAVLPTLLALSQHQRVSGEDFMAAGS